MKSQAYGHFLENPQVQGHQHSVLSRIAAVGTRTSATSSDFARPKARTYQSHVWKYSQYSQQKHSIDCEGPSIAVLLVV